MCILFVEDEPVILMVAEEALKDAGHAVIVARDGPEAFAHLEQHPRHFSVLVTDLHLPGEIDGLAIVKHMRGTYPTIPMFIATAIPSKIPHSAPAELQFSVIPKPYSIADVIAKIEAVK
jgi:CheY-like chemotaxis protein